MTLKALPNIPFTPTSGIIDTARDIIIKITGWVKIGYETIKTWARWVLDFTEKTIQNLQSLANGKGLGVLWWEPQAYNWKGYGKVAWNSNSGTNAYRATDAMKGFQYGCKNTPQIPAKVNVTFRVNMTGQNTANGVYITGSMTTVNANWQIVPMVNEGNGIYSKTFEMSPQDTGAFYFLNANNWTNREVVPSTCAKSYGKDRSYLVGSKNQEIKREF